MAFVLVRADSLREGATPQTLDINRNPIAVPAHEINRFRRKYYKLIGAFDRDHACEVAAKVVNPVTHQKVVMSAGSTREGSKHAEESLLIQCYNNNHHWTQVELDSILIDIEPCHGGRYPGHLCFDLFRPVGRHIPISGGHPVLFRFTPKVNKAFTPIIYFQDQPAPGAQARARAWKTGKASDYLDEKLYKLGPPPGTIFYTNIKKSTQ